MKKVASSLLTGLLAGGGLAVLVALLAPATAAHAATVACTAPGNLYAVSGSTTLGVQSVRVWGYNTTGAPATAPGGPTLCVNAGDTVTVTLHNALTDASDNPVTENTALLFQGQEMIPDRTGAAPGATKLYKFTASKPGTYLYEAGLVPNAQHQVAMGLYGALIVRPATAGQAYDDTTTAYDDEAVLVLSEIDPALNNRTVAQGGPATFDMRKYAPRYSLINGKAHPNTDPIPATTRRQRRPVALRQRRQPVPLDGITRRRAEGDRPGRQPAELLASLRRGDLRSRPDRGRHRHDPGRDYRAEPIGDLRRQPAAAQQQHGRHRRDAHLRHGPR